ncbi:GAF domain-containing protein, partial [bacterium]|nr:GAF domain-containing protein [bacterium]
MNEPNFTNHIRFVDIAANPYLYSLYNGFKTFLPDAEWWILDNQKNRLPFPPDFSSQPIKDPSHCREIINTSQDSTLCIADGCDGYLQGITHFRFRDRVIGGIGICHVQPEHRHFLEQTLHIIEGYFSLLGSALEDHDDLEFMHNIWAETITITDLCVLLERVMEEICGVMNVCDGMIFLINEDGEFYPAQIKNYPQQIFHVRDLDINRLDYQESLNPTNPPLIILPEDDPLRMWVLHAIEAVEGKSQGNPNCYAVPFYRNNLLIGIFVSFAEHMDHVTENRKSLLRLLSTGSAAAIDNAMTLERMNQRRKALSTIHVVHRLMTSRITTKDLLPKIGQLAKQLLKAKKCSIMLSDADKTRLLPEVALGLDKNEIGQFPLKFGEELPGWVAENFNPIIYHPKTKAPTDWIETGAEYPSACYMGVALFEDDIEGVITVSGKSDFTPGDREILVTFAEQVIIALRNARQHEGEQSITVNALKSIANIIETHDPETAGTLANTCDWAQKIAKQLRLSEAERRNITFAALLHDTGMLRSYQSNIPLDEQQRKGPHLSKRFVHYLGLPEEVETMVFHVNESWDGNGFPQGLKGNKIPLGSRIIAVASTFTQ